MGRPSAPASELLDFSLLLKATRVGCQQVSTHCGWSGSSARIGHGYQGSAAVITIILNGMVTGALAAWHGNIRAGILEHSAWDIVAGFGIVT